MFNYTMLQNMVHWGFIVLSQNSLETFYSCIFCLHIYTNGAIFPMLAQVLYIAYTPLCRWYMKHTHHFAK